MSIQILHYEFLGPVALDQWGPPMEKVVYVMLSRNKDQFRPVYAGVCEKTDDKAFFVSNPAFKCWVSLAGSDRNLYLAILPLFDSGPDKRKYVLEKIVSSIKPPCNGEASGGQADQQP